MCGLFPDLRRGQAAFYEKNGIKSEPIPYHGAKEMGKGLANKIIKRYGI